MQSGASTVEEQKEWIKNAMAKIDEITFIIEHRNIPVGMFAVCNINKIYKHCSIERLLLGETEIVGHSPVAYECELLVCDYIFSEMKMHKIYGDIMEDNIDMIKYRKYLGYRFDGMLRDHYIFNGVFKNTHLISLLRSEYYNKCRKKILFLIELNQASTS